MKCYFNCVVNLSMPGFISGRLKFALILLVSVMLSGCSSGFTTIAPLPPEKYEIIGPTQGEAMGSLGVLSTAYYFIPMGINSRVASAYENALANAPGSTGLIDVTIEESWFWWVIGTARTVTVSGVAVKEIR